MAAERALVATEDELSAASSGWVPDLTLGLGYKDQADGFSGLAFNLALPVPLFDARGGAKESAGARRQAAAASLELRTVQARADVLASHQRYESVRDRLERFGDPLSTEAEALLVAAGTAYEEGELALIELLDAARVFLDAQITAISLRAETWIVYYDLLRATGRHPEDTR